MNAKQFNKHSLKESEYWILSVNGKWFKPENFVFSDLNNGVGHDFKCLVEKEALKAWKPTSDESANVSWMKRLHLAEFDRLSDAGHLRFLSRGALIFDLISDYSMQLALEEGAAPIHSSILYNMDEAEILEHLNLFGERSYQIMTQNNNFVLRYAACFGQFSMCKNKVFSYRHLPLKVFEIADSYRYEQHSEISGMMRQRRFTMPDMHIFCQRDQELEHTRQEFLHIHRLILQIATKQDWRFVSLYNVREDFANNYSDFLKELVQIENQPALIRLVDSAKGYYWLINIEYCIIDAQDRPVEIATVQIDIGNGKRFNIQYQRADGSIEYPVILHTALIGSIERFFFGILEMASKKANELKKPFVLPFWIAPIQVRLIPVAERHFTYVSTITENLIKAGIRADIDDRNKGLSRKIRDAERETIEYICIIGDKEIESQEISIRHRLTRRTFSIQLDKWIPNLQKHLHHKPNRPNYLPHKLSMIPEFF